MRKGVYWLNLMTEDEQINFYSDGPINPRGLTKTYDTFEEFIRSTVYINNDLPRDTRKNLLIYWRCIIVKYYGYDKLSPRKYLEPLKF